MNYDSITVQAMESVIKIGSCCLLSLFPGAEEHLEHEPKHRESTYDVDLDCELLFIVLMVLVHVSL